MFAQQQTPEVLREALDTIGFSVFRQALVANPPDLAQKMYSLYRVSSTIHRVINQVVEQVMADAEIKPVISAPDNISQLIEDWWMNNHGVHLIRRSFKEFLLSGEVWIYVPRTKKKEGVKAHLLVPWNINTIEGYSAHDWMKAQYIDADTGQALTLDPENAVFIAHDALFGGMRGITPFTSLFFAVQTYEDWLQGRVRINRLAGNVIGKMRFSSVEEAANSLPNASMREDDGEMILDITGPVQIPPSGTMAVLIGEESDFDLITPRVGASNAKEDGEALWRTVIEASRLPEFLSGWGRGVNVATARVQYPFAVRMMLALRDEFGDAIKDMIRLMLRRLVEHRIIPPTWKDEDGRTWTPETVAVHLTWPDIRELDFDAISRTVLGLLQQGVIDTSVALHLLGWEPEELERVAAQEGKVDVDKVGQILGEALDAWLERQLATKQTSDPEPG